MPLTHRGLLWSCDAKRRAEQEALNLSLAAHEGSLAFLPSFHVIGFTNNFLYNLGQVLVNLLFWMREYTNPYVFAPGGAGPECFEHAHADLHSVYDFSWWAVNHAGNEDVFRAGRTNPIAQWAERDGATLRLKEGGGVFYAPGPLQSVAVHWPRLVAGAQSGALYHLEVQG